MESSTTTPRQRRRISSLTGREDTATTSTSLPRATPKTYYQSQSQTQIPTPSSTRILRNKLQDETNTSSVPSTRSSRLSSVSTPLSRNSRDRTPSPEAKPSLVEQSGGGEDEIPRSPSNYYTKHSQSEDQLVNDDENALTFLFNYVIWLLKLVSYCVMSIIIWLDIQILYAKRRKGLLYLILACLTLFILSSLIGPSQWSNPFAKLNPSLPKPSSDNVDWDSYVAQKVEYNTRKVIEKFEEKIRELTGRPSQPSSQEMEAVVKSVLSDELRKIRDELKASGKESTSVNTIVIQNLESQIAELQNWKAQSSSLLQAIEKLTSDYRKQGDDLRMYVVETINDRIKNTRVILDDATKQELASLIEVRLSQHQYSVSEDQLKVLIAEALRTAPPSEATRHYISEIVGTAIANRFGRGPGGLTISLTRDEVQRMIDESYDNFIADKIGKSVGPDYALRSAGASVILSRTSSAYTGKDGSGWFDWMSKRGYASTPSIVLEPDNTVGNCFAFEGQHGYITIRLAMPISPRRFTLEHVDPNIAYHFSSAPKEFRVLGFQDVNSEPVVFGEYTYNKDAGRQIQTFTSDLILDEKFEIITLEILSNYGHPDYTCVYRFRVHGEQ